MTRIRIALRYSLFAFIATLGNLAAQECVVRAYSGDFALLLAMGCGTGVGLISKYQLDKHYIFAITWLPYHKDLQRFFVYSLTGVLTTALFWTFELGFELLFAGKTARYSGAAIGLALGYSVKYRLDKHWVFRVNSGTWQ